MKYMFRAFHALVDTDESNMQDLKLKFYDLMIQHALHQSSYLDVAKYYHKVWETPSIKDDVNDKGKAASIINFFK